MMRKSPFTAATLVAVIAFVSSPLFVAGAAAQVVVEESEPIRGLGQQRTNSPSQSNSASGNANTQAEFFYQMQLLQQEVQNLRGMVEQLTYEVQQLKQQRMDDYLDLDRRISELSAGGAPVAGADTAGPTNVTPGADQASRANPSTRTNVGAGNLPASDEEIETYRGAMDLLLQQKDYDGAIAALNQYLADYPQGTYAPNSQYWLGEIYLLQNDLAEAQRWFSQLIEQFPNDRKASDAKYKLGRVYFQMGEKDRAEALLEEVAASDSEAATLAQNFLLENYP